MTQSTETTVIHNRRLIGERIELLRKKYGYGRKELSVKLNFSPNLVGHWERGISSPQPHTLVQLATMFHTTVDYLTGKTDNPLLPTNDAVDIDEILNKVWIYKGEQLSQEKKEKVYNILKNTLDLLQ